jgi:hypothetical protein
MKKIKKDLDQLSKFSAILAKYVHAFKVDAQANALELEQLNKMQATIKKAKNKLSEFTASAPKDSLQKPLPTFVELYNDFRSSFSPIFDDLRNYSKVLYPDSSSIELIKELILSYPISSLRGKDLDLELVISKLIIGFTNEKGEVKLDPFDIMPAGAIRPFMSDGMTCNPGIKADDGSYTFKIAIEDEKEKKTTQEFWVAIWLQVASGYYEED